MGSYGHSGVDPVRKTAPKNQNPWRLFKGDDLTYPVEMFIHIMEFKNAQVCLTTDSILCTVICKTIVQSGFFFGHFSTR